MPDTSIRHYSSYSSGQVVWGGVGSLINALDECLINGGPSYNISSISVANNIATMNVSLPHYIDPLYYSGTVLLLHGDGTNNGVIFTDSSQNNATMTYSGAVTSTGTKKFGTASLYFAGSGNNYVATPSSTNFGFGTSDFTMEFWVNADATQPQTSSVMLNSYNAAWGANQWLFYAKSTTPIIYLFVANYSTTVPLITGTTNILGAGWTHIAITRNGPYFRLFVNGIQEGNIGNFAGSFDSGSSSFLAIGRKQYYEHHLLQRLYGRDKNHQRSLSLYFQLYSTPMPVSKFIRNYHREQPDCLYQRITRCGIQR